MVSHIIDYTQFDEGISDVRRRSHHQKHGLRLRRHRRVHGFCQRQVLRAVAGQVEVAGRGHGYELRYEKHLQNNYMYGLPISNDT